MEDPTSGREPSPPLPPSWVKLWPAQMLAETAHLSEEELGVFFRLLLGSWQTGRIPAEKREVSRRLFASLQRTKKVLSGEVGRMLTPHPTDPNSLVYKPWHDAREKMVARYQQQRAASMVGAVTRRLVPVVKPYGHQNGRRRKKREDTLETFPSASTGGGASAMAQAIAAWRLESGRDLEPAAYEALGELADKRPELLRGALTRAEWGEALRVSAGAAQALSEALTRRLDGAAGGSGANRPKPTSDPA